MEKCSRCGVIKTEKNAYLKPDKNGKYQSYCKDCNNYKRKSALRAFKQQCVNYKGGKCQKCGYDKCIAALEFHHLDPSQKEFAISVSRQLNFNKVQQELDKCQLLCSNCHNETHYDSNFVIELKSPKLEFKCSDCNVSITSDTKRCYQCYIKHHARNIPNKDELLELLISNKFIFVKVAKHYNVSDKAVYKWCTKYNINRPDKK